MSWSVSIPPVAAADFGAAIDDALEGAALYVAYDADQGAAAKAGALALADALGSDVVCASITGHAGGDETPSSEGYTGKPSITLSVSAAEIVE